MNRRKAREYALQMLFLCEFIGIDKVITPPDDLWYSKEKQDSLREFADDLISGTRRNLERIDGVITEAAENWELQRMAAVDRNILRFAVYEIIFRADIPSAVTINEALEIAKKYSATESVPFINGLLDKIARDCGKA